MWERTDCDTDIRRTFERIRDQQAQADPQSRVNVLRLDQLKKAGWPKKNAAEARLVK